MIQLTDTVWAVKVPDEAEKIHIANSKLMWVPDTVEDEYHDFDLPPGNWQFICTSDQAREEQAAGIVEYIECGRFAGYADYECPANDLIPIELAVHSLASLLRSKSLEGNYALIRKL